MFPTDEPTQLPSSPPPLVAGGEAATSPPAAPRWTLAPEFTPARVDSFTLPEPYQALTVQLWLNPSDAEVRRFEALTDDEQLATVIKGWTLRDADGQPIPVCAEAMGLLGMDQKITLFWEWRQRRQRPLQLKNLPGFELSTLLNTATPTEATNGSKT